MEPDARHTSTVSGGNVAAYTLRSGRPSFAAPTRADVTHAASRNTRLTAFAFDVDGVLADTASLHTAAWRRLADEEGLLFSDDLAARLRGLSREASLRHLLGSRRVTPDAFRQLADRKNRYYIASLDDVGPQHAMPGAIELVNGLKKLGLRVAAVSLSRNARLVLDKLGILDAFSVLIDGARTGGRANRLNRYLLAALELRTTPDRCAVVEDSAAGIAAARQMGMRTVGIGNTDRLCAATLVLDSFVGVDANDLLRRLESRPGPFHPTI